MSEILSINIHRVICLMCVVFLKLLKLKKYCPFSHLYIYLQGVPEKSTFNDF